MGSRRGWVGAAAALVLVVVAAGCGQSDGATAGGSGEVEIKTVAANTEAAGTARFEGSFQPSRNSRSPGGHFEGEVDFVNGRSAVRSTYDAGGGQGSHETESRLVDGWTYFKTPSEGPGAAPATGATPWSRIRLPSFGGSMLPMGMSADATAYLDLLDSMGVRTEVVGTEAVRGTPTTRYRVTRAEPTNVPAQLRLDSDFSAARSDPGSIDLWVDHAGRLRRLVTDFGDESSEEGGGGGSSSLELFDFGAPVTVEAPPLDQVTTQPSIPEPHDYRLAATGTADGAAWKVFVAEAGTEQEQTRCVEVEADVAQWFRAVVGAGDRRVSLGCSSSSSGTSAPGAPPPPAPIFPRPQAVPLADGRALLISEVPEGTTAVTIRLRGGGEQAVAPSGGWFGAALGHDEVAEVVSFTRPSGTSRCRLHDSSYDCDTDGFGGVDGSGSSVSSSVSGSSVSGGAVSGSSVSGSSSATSTVPRTTTGR
jgi:hypothetical protein